MDSVMIYIKKLTTIGDNYTILHYIKSMGL